MKDIINTDFVIPHYIFQEIVEYIEETAKGRSKCMKWQNIRALLRCAMLNNRNNKRTSKISWRNIL